MQLESIAGLRANQRWHIMGAMRQNRTSLAGRRGSVKDANSTYQVQVLDRAVAILQALLVGGELSLIEVSEQLDLHKSTVHRLLMVLERHRLVEKSPRNGKFALGLKLFEFGSAAVAGLDLRDRTRPYLEHLVFETGETTHLCVLDGGEVLYLDKVEPSRAVRVPSNVGRRNPAHCTAVGKVLLAFLPAEKLDDFIRKYGLRSYTPNTITNAMDVKHELGIVRERGYAIDNEEIEEGLICIGAPIWAYSGDVIASISIAGPAFRISAQKIPTLARLVMETAAKLSAELGFQPTADIGGPRPL